MSLIVNTDILAEQVYDQAPDDQLTPAPPATRRPVDALSPQIIDRRRDALALNS